MEIWICEDCGRVVMVENETCPECKAKVGQVKDSPQGELKKDLKEDLLPPLGICAHGRPPR